MASKHRLYVDQPLVPHQQLTLDAAASHYLTRVLRLRTEATLELFNGDGQNYSATLLDSNKSAAVVEVCEGSPGPHASPKLHLALALLKGDRLDFALQKATELDVASIYLTHTRRSELRLTEKRLNNRLDHWRRILVSASEQSGRTRLPELLPPQPLSAVLDATAEHARYCLQPGEADGEILVGPVDVCLFTGPEGGFDDDELAQLATATRVIALGDLVLRAETAPLVGLALAAAARRRSASQ